MRGVGTGVRLTAKERILLHLLEHVKDAGAVEVVPEMTQEGISEAAGIDLRHFTQYVRPLVEEGLVRERTAHGKGDRQRRRVYALTEAGRMQAVRLRENLRAERVRVRDGDLTREMAVSEV